MAQTKTTTEILTLRVRMTTFAASELRYAGLVGGRLNDVDGFWIEDSFVDRNQFHWDPRAQG